MSDEQRFTVKCKEDFHGGEILIIVDGETGVNYLCTQQSGLSALTPLLDEDGKVVIDL